MRSCKRHLYLVVPLVFAAQLAYGQAGGLPAEISAREAADVQLQNNINAEATARAAGDTQLQNNINAEATARGAADTALRNSINDETAARALREAQLQGNIDGEAAARAAGDAALRGGIESEAGTRAAADAQLQTQIDQLRNNGGGGGSGGGTATVDCNAGQTVSQALASGAKQIIVRGICHESVSVAADDVTLQADPAGGRIDGPNADVNTVQVTGNRVTIDGLTVTGGRNGITGVGANNLTLRNCTVQSTGRTGIAYANGSSGIVDGCTAQANARDGIAVDGAHATIINSTASNNTRFGIIVANGSRGRLGMTDRFAAAPNTITQNGGAGVVISQGSFAAVAMSTITNNGTSPAQSPRAGVSVTQSVASISGNTISGNAGTGVNVFGGGNVQLGDASFGLPTLNTISGNGNPASPGGVAAILGSTLVVRDAVIESNNGPGLLYSIRSQGQLTNTNIRNNLDVATTSGIGVNAGDGIRVIFGSTLFPLTPGSAVTGNSGFGLTCSDGESSAINTAPPSLTFSGNLRGDIPNCSGF